MASNKKELQALITLAGKVDPSLKKALQQAQGQTSKTTGKLNKLGSTAGKTMKKIGKGIAVAGAAIVSGATAGIAALGKLTNETMTYADKIDKMSIRTGLSYGELQRLEYVAGQVGVNFDGLTNAIGIMTKNMSAADKEGSAAAQAFARLGVETKGLNGQLRPQGEIFKESIYALSEMENATERNARAFKIFGRGASDMIPLFDAGTQGIAELAAQADKFGMVMDYNTVQAGVKLQDTLDLLKKSFRGLGFGIAGEVMPIIQNFSEGLINKMPEIQSIARDTLGGLAQGIVDLLPGIFDILSQATPLIISILSMITSAAPTIFDTIQQLLPIIMEVAMQVLPLVSEAISMIFSLIKPLLPPLMQLIKALLPPLIQIIKIIFALIEPFIPIITMLVEQLMPPLTQILSAWMVYLEALTPIFSAVANVIGVVLGGAIKLVMPLIKGLADIISKIVGGVGKAIGAVGKLLGLGGKKVDIQADIPKFAGGGMAYRPSIFGEAGPEMAIPIKYKNPRSLSLLNQTAKAIGAEQRGVMPGIALSFNFYGPVNNREDVTEGVKLARDYIVQVVDDILEEKARVSFG